MILIENGMKQAPDIFIAYSNDLRFKERVDGIPARAFRCAVCGLEDGSVK